MGNNRSEVEKRLPRRYEPIGRLNAICPYYTMFPLEFPYRRLLRAKSGDWVLDPFCGRGTTNFAARLLGLSSVGIDSNPVAAAIASAKLVNATSAGIVRLCRSILSAKRKPSDVPRGKFWSLCYHPRTLQEVCKLREELLQDCSSQERIALRGLLLGVLHGPQHKTAPSYLSNQMPRTYATKPVPAVNFWLKRKMRPSYVSTVDLVATKASYFFRELPRRTGGVIVQKDSRFITGLPSSARFRWVITSPPYLGMRSYKSDQWLRNWFLGGPPTVDYAHDGQLSHRGQHEFAHDLSLVWRRMALLCEPGASLIVRFGALPSVRRNPLALLKKSIVMANAGWVIRTVRRAGKASNGRRQACQFVQSTRSAVEEMDLHAVLDT
jgi:hypothetical protein